MTYAECNSIRRVIEGFFETGVVDEVLVVNNNAEEGTAEEVPLTNARQVFEPRQGYGHAIRRGLVEASGALVLLSEPDGFLPLGPLKDAQRRVRSGARHTHHPGADMAWRKYGWFLRWCNWAVAKLVEVLFNTTHLSDMGCSYPLPREAQPLRAVGLTAFRERAFCAI